MNLTYKHEASLFTILMVISVIFWLAIFAGTFGGVLVYILFGFLFYLFAQSGLISYLKGTAVKLTPSQFPDLNSRVHACCQKVGLSEVPDVYILHADGAFNAFATRFLRRNYIVLFSDVVDALESRPEALNFYIGHEIGHIHRKHLIWAPVIFPAAILPIIGAAYSRAREYTCDNYGFACCDSPEDALLGMAALSAGGKRWKTLSIDQYAAQSMETGGFWMSFNELISDYPWLVKRMARISAKAGGTEPVFPRRSFFAWLLAAFIPRTMVGTGGGSILVTVCIIGIIAAIAIPNFVAYRDKARARSEIEMQQSSPYDEYQDEETTVYED